MMKSVTMTAVAGLTSSAKSPRHSKMEDGRALPASVLTAANHLIECTPTTHSVPDCRRLRGLNVTGATMCVPREMAMTRMTTQKLDSIQLYVLLLILRHHHLAMTPHLLILRTVPRSKEDVFVALIMVNAPDTQVQILHRGREQSSHHASILMDIFNVTSLMTALK